MQWDSAITLAYAAEQLFAASQLLTSDLVPSNRALRTAYESHIAPLLENERFLPESIREKLIVAQQSYRAAESTGLTRGSARQLAAELMSILRDITARLSGASSPPSWKIVDERVA